MRERMQGFNHFSEVDSFHQSIWSLLKNSGKLKAEIKKACKAMNIHLLFVVENPWNTTFEPP